MHIHSKLLRWTGRVAIAALAVGVTVPGLLLVHSGGMRAGLWYAVAVGLVGLMLPTKQARRVNGR